MSWRLRALLLRAMATGPGGLALYQWLQRHHGTHHQPGERLQKIRLQCDLARLIRSHGKDFRGSELVEVGTGWVPLVPLAFWICGARSVRTFDLNRYLLPGLLSGAVRWMRETETELLNVWEEFEEVQLLRERLGLVYGLEQQPEALLEQTGIEYVAPADAAETDLGGDSVDVHYSVSVLEHVTPESIGAILDEAARILRPDGLSVHVIDPSDHFSHHDPSISRVNFLQFEPEEWRRLAGNDLAYHNRLRCADFERCFGASDLELWWAETRVNERSLEALESGLSLASPYRGIAPEDLCREDLKVVARPAPTR